VSVGAEKSRVNKKAEDFRFLINPPEALNGIATAR
jgi:hypothetical protein